MEVKNSIDREGQTPAGIQERIQRKLDFMNELRVQKNLILLPEEFVSEFSTAFDKLKAVYSNEKATRESLALAKINFSYVFLKELGE